MTHPRDVVKGNPREIYGDEVLEALYEDIRAWPEVMSLDVTDPDEPHITFWPTVVYGSHYISPPTEYLVDYRHHEEGCHWTEHVRGVSEHIPYRSGGRQGHNWKDPKLEDTRYSDRRVYVERSIKAGSLCHGGRYFDSQEPFEIFATLRQWHIGIWPYYTAQNMISLANFPEDSKVIIAPPHAESDRKAVVVPLTKEMVTGNYLTMKEAIKEAARGRVPA